MILLEARNLISERRGVNMKIIKGLVFKHVGVLMLAVITSEPEYRVNVREPVSEDY